VVTAHCTTGGSTMDLLTQVDRQLYLAKSSGRNRVEYAAPHKVGGAFKDNILWPVGEESFCGGKQCFDTHDQLPFQFSDKNGLKSAQT
jgi:hypothetical protein